MGRCAARYAHEPANSREAGSENSPGAAMNNIFRIPSSAAAGSDEFFETLLQGGGNVRVERIISHGQTTPENSWYDQEQDEWVIVLQGHAAIAFAGGEEISLAQGDHLLLPRHVLHRVTRTSSPCVWLAVFGDSLAKA